jgi:hypothetical protein
LFTCSSLIHLLVCSKFFFSYLIHGICNFLIILEVYFFYYVDALNSVGFICQNVAQYGLFLIYIIYRHFCYSPTKCMTVLI